MKPIVIYSSRIPGMLGAEALCLAPFIIFSQCKKKTLKCTMKHELIHFEQAQRDGLLTFHIGGLVDMLSKWARTGSYLKAVTETPYELEAYGRERERLKKHEKALLGLQAK